MNGVVVLSSPASLGSLSEAFAAAKVVGTARYFTEHHPPARVADNLRAATSDALGFAAPPSHSGDCAAIFRLDIA